MAEITIAAVNDRRTRRRFLTFPWKIYAGDPLWVPPLLPERARRIDPGRGTFFKRGTAELFIAYRDGVPAGTICAAEDTALNRRSGRQECIFGFFESIEDPEVAGALIERVLLWAGKRGLKTLAGPFNLDYEDGYGVLIEGRDKPPAMLCGHTPAYYSTYLENLGFVPLRGDALAYEIDVDRPGPEFLRTERLLDRVRRRGWITIRTPDPRRWQQEVDVVQDLLNRSTTHLPDYRPWEREAVQSLIEPFAAIADPELVLFAEADGRTIGWFPGVPDVNETLIHLNGLRYPWDRIRGLYWRRRPPRTLAVKSVLVLPEYWGSGVALLLFHEMRTRAAAKGYRRVDLSLTSADNPYTPGLAERMGARLYKRYRIYSRPVSAA
jgi:GNAT superfamily N-acetyltransferase